MALPEKPLTRREMYLAKAAGMETTLPEEDITREEIYLRAIAEGGGGGVTPEYVAEAIAEAKTDIEAEIPTKTSELTNDSGYAAIDDTTAAQNKAYSSAKVEEKVAGEEITTTATGTDMTLSTSSGNVNALTIYGKSEIVDGSIISAGEGWATVDLGTLTWAYSTNPEQGWAVFTAPVPNIVSPSVAIDRLKGLLCPLYPISANSPYASMQNKSMLRHNGKIVIKDNDFTDEETFTSAMNGVILAYEEATPANNTIAIKPDNGSGTNGTMATFSTGTPLRGIPDTDVRDVMEWNGSAGTVTKSCGEVDLGTLNWTYNTTFQTPIFVVPLNEIGGVSNSINFVCPKYNPKSSFWTEANNDMCIGSGGSYLNISNSQYTNPNSFRTAMNGVMLVYEVANPTTQPLTSTENASIAGLRTFEPQTHAQNNAQTDMTIEAYARTANGKAVNELKQDVQSEISVLKITQSDTLTLTVAGWSSNQQTVTYAHDVSKRNVIDVDPASVEEWASCGVLATAETATSITFTCKTVPENALTFRVTSMGV